MSRQDRPSATPPAPRWIEIADPCCNTVDGKKEPSLEVTKFHIKQDGRGLDVELKMAHACGIKNWRVVITVFKTRRPIYNYGDFQDFDCDPPKKDITAAFRWGFNGRALPRGLDLRGHVIRLTAVATSCCYTQRVIRERRAAL